MAVALNGHQLVDPLGAEPHDPADVVAGQVDEHHVLGPLLRVLDELCLEPAVLLVARAPPAGAGDGTRDDTAVEELDHRLGRRPDHRDPALAQEEHVRAGVDLPEHPVDVERVATEVEVEALREDDLKGVTGPDVILGDLDGLPEGVRGRPAAHLAVRQGRRRRGRRRQSVAARLLEVAPHGLEAPQGIRVSGLERGPGRPGGRPVRVEQDVVDECDPLAPVIKCGQLTDDRDDGVGVPEVVGRGRRKPFDLPDDVVAEVPDETPVKRWELPERRRLEPLEERLEARESTPSSRGTESGRAPWVTVMVRPRATKVAAGQRPTKENRLQRSPCSTDSSRKPGPSPTIARKAPTGVRLSATSSRQTGTTEWRRAIAKRRKIRAPRRARRRCQPYAHVVAAPNRR